MIASVSTGALDGMRVLEIGGGIGRIQAELLAAGADRGEVVELVAAYEPYARELARETGLEGRTSFRIVDILEEPDAVEPADIVVLNRVVCCSRTVLLSPPPRRGWRVGRSCSASRAMSSGSELASSS